MITFKRYKNKLKVVPMGSHSIVSVTGKPIAYLDDTTSSIVEIIPTSDSELNMLCYVCDTLGYKHKGYQSHTYEQKLSLKRLHKELKDYQYELR